MPDKELERENAELRERIADLTKPPLYDGYSLQKKNAELSNSVAELTNSKTELENKVTELEKQIEKMKCCYNCKYGRIYFVKEIIVDCLANKVNPNNKYENCNKWELAE